MRPARRRHPIRCDSCGRSTEVILGITGHVVHKNAICCVIYDPLMHRVWAALERHPSKRVRSFLALTIFRPGLRLHVWMEEVLSASGATADQNRRISEIIAREQARLHQFIRARVPDTGDAEDILQEVFYELIAAYRLMKPVEQVGAWLFRVARNRIVDLFRSKRPAVLGNDSMLYPKTARGTDGKICFLRRMQGQKPLMHAACCWNNWMRPSKICRKSSATFLSPMK